METTEYLVYVRILSGTVLGWTFATEAEQRDFAQRCAQAGVIDTTIYRNQQIASIDLAIHTRRQAYLSGGTPVAMRPGIENTSIISTALAGNRYKFCPLCATALGEIKEGGETFKHCSSCRFTHYNNPVAAAVAVIPHEGGFVLVKRKAAPKAGMYALPGGFINHGEGPREACVREVFEETGLVVEVVRPLAEVKVPGHNEFIVFYLTRVTGGKLEAGDDAEEAGVYTLDALPENMAFPAHLWVLEEWNASVLHCERYALTEAQPVATFRHAPWEFDPLVEPLPAPVLPLTRSQRRKRGSRWFF